MVNNQGLLVGEEFILKKDDIFELNKVFNFPSNFQVNVAPFGTPEGISVSSTVKNNDTDLLIFKDFSPIILLSYKVSSILFDFWVVGNQTMLSDNSREAIAERVMWDLNLIISIPELERVDITIILISLTSSGLDGSFTLDVIISNNYDKNTKSGNNIIFFPKIKHGFNDLLKFGDHNWEASNKNLVINCTIYKYAIGNDENSYFCKEVSDNTTTTFALKNPGICSPIRLIFFLRHRFQRGTEIIDPSIHGEGETLRAIYLAQSANAQAVNAQASLSHVPRNNIAKEIYGYTPKVFDETETKRVRKLAKSIRKNN
ncbi:hypothetical protein ACTFIR_007561 [Dictyostelium discoideum]